MRSRVEGTQRSAAKDLSDAQPVQPQFRVEDAIFASY
jgi:hypothetical protein